MSGTWRVVVVESPALERTALGAAAVAHSDWVRLFLGRALAPAKLVGDPCEPASVEYLVLGAAVSASPAGGLPDDLLVAASNDFARLAAALQWHRTLITKVHEDCQAGRGPLASPEFFLSSYAVLSCVTVSLDAEDWLVTDEGLSIVRWGLSAARCRPLLALTNSELDELRGRVLGRANRDIDAAREAERRVQAAEKDRIRKAHHAANQGVAVKPLDAPRASPAAARQQEKVHSSRNWLSRRTGMPGALVEARLMRWAWWAVAGGAALCLVLLAFLLWRLMAPGAARGAMDRSPIQPAPDPAAAGSARAPAKAA